MQYHPTNNVAFDYRSPHHYGRDRFSPKRRWASLGLQVTALGVGPNSNVFKPAIMGEMGMTDGMEGDRCTDSEFHNGMWASGCSWGFGAGLYRYEYQSDAKRAAHFPALRAFFDGIPSESNNFHSVYYADGLQEDNYHVEALYNVNESKSKAYGWIHNIYYYWVNDPTIQPNCIQDMMGNTLGTTSTTNNEIKLDYFQNGKHFKIELWNCYGAGGYVSSFTKTANILTGRIRFSTNLGGYVGSPDGNPDYGIKVYRPNASFRLSDTTETDTGYVDLDPDSLDIDTSQVTVLGRVISNGGYHHWDFGNGHSSDELYPTTNYPESGTYTVMYSTLNSFGDTVHYRQKMTINLKGDIPVNKQFGNIQISVVPNPSNGRFTIYSPNDDMLTYSVYDLRGALILTSMGSENSFDLATFKNGMYFVVIQTRNKGAFSKKIIKQD